MNYGACRLEIFHMIIGKVEHGGYGLSIGNVGGFFLRSFLWFLFSCMIEELITWPIRLVRRRMHASRCIHIHMHTHYYKFIIAHDTHTWMHILIHTYIHTYIRAYTYIHACIRTKIHTWMYTFMHTYIIGYTHAYIQQ